MFFEQESPAFSILDVWELDQEHADGVNRNRNYHALSLRYRSDAVLTASTHTCRPGDFSLCYIPANVDYRRTATHDRLIVIHFALYNYFSSEIESFTPADFDKYRVLFEEALQSWSSLDPAYKNRTAAILYRILAEIYAENKSGREYPPILRQAVDHIRLHFKEPELCVGALARRAHVSEVYLRRLFQRHLHTSPKRYILDERIRYAASLIHSGYYTVTEVAALSGFCDSKYFSLLFKRYTGVSPSQYQYNFHAGGKNPAALPSETMEILDNSASMCYTDTE